MKAIRNFWESIVLSVFKPARPIPAGVFQYQSDPDAPQPYRLHLRLNGDGDGILIVNASTVLHLNQTAAEYAYYLVNRIPTQEAANLVVKRYRVPQNQAIEDISQFKERIDTLIHEQDLDPITFLDFEEQDPYSSDLSAPLRLDCALTYQFNGGQTAGLAPMDRVKAELSTSEWQTILEKAWQAGIPHVIFTGGEPTLRSDLSQLIAHAENLGMVTGLLSTGYNLLMPYALNQLLQAGLDHIMILLDPLSDGSWQVVQSVQAADIFQTVHLTISPQILSQAPSILNRLADLGVKSLSLSAVDNDLVPSLLPIRQLAAELGLNLVADLPVPYSQFNPVSLELLENFSGSSGAGSKWLYVEPDGDVLPAQGILTPMGNFLNQSWNEIWESRPLK